MRYAPIVFATFIFAHFAIAQATKEVSVREPGVYDLTALFKRADRVALVKVTAGDSEAYTTAVYKAEVVKGFKGRSGGQTLFFGPYLGNKLGSEYILFLHDASKTISPKTHIEKWIWNCSIRGSVRRRLLLDGNLLRMCIRRKGSFPDMRLRRESLYRLHQAAKVDASVSVRGQ